MADNNNDSITVSVLDVEEKRYPVIMLAHRHGTVTLRFVNAYIAEVRKLNVYERHLRQGIGTRLTQEAEKHARELGITKLTLTCRADNVAGCAFYKKNGYIAEGLLKNHYGPKRDLIVYSKFLREVE